MTLLSRLAPLASLQPVTNPRPQRQIQDYRTACKQQSPALDSPRNPTALAGTIFFVILQKSAESI